MPVRTTETEFPEGELMEETVAYAPSLPSSLKRNSPPAPPLSPTRLAPKKPLEAGDLNTEELVEEEQPEEPLPGAAAEPGISRVTVREPIAAEPFFSEPFLAREPRRATPRKSIPASRREPAGDSNTGMNPTEPAIHEPDADEGSPSRRTFWPPTLTSLNPRPILERRSPLPPRVPSAESDRSASHHVDPLPAQRVSPVWVRRKEEGRRAGSGWGQPPPAAPAELGPLGPQVGFGFCARRRPGGRGSHRGRRVRRSAPSSRQGRRARP